MSKNTLADLIRQRDELDARINEIRAEQRSAAIMQATSLIAEFELTAVELGLVRTQHIKARKNGAPTFPAKPGKAPRPPRYRNPATGDTWSGFGRAPAWMEGPRDEYLIEKT